MGYIASTRSSIHEQWGVGQEKPGFLKSDISGRSSDLPPEYWSRTK